MPAGVAEGLARVGTGGERGCEGETYIRAPRPRISECLSSNLDAVGSALHVSGRLMFSASVSCSKLKLREATVHTVWKPCG